MKSIAIAGLLATTAVAWPTNLDKLTGRSMDDVAALLQNDILKRAAAPPQGAGALPAAPPPFDAKAQYVSNKGAHAFIAPGPGDDRGECPGLNAMANHVRITVLISTVLGT